MRPIALANRDLIYILILAAARRAYRIPSIFCILIPCHGLVMNLVFLFIPEYPMPELAR